MLLFGYACSAYCVGQAERAGVELPVYEHQKSVVEARFWKKVRTVVAIVLAFLAALAGLLFWYNFAGSRPKPAYTVAFPEKRENGFCKFIAKDQVVIRHGNKLARYDLSKQKELWSTHLIDPQLVEDSAVKWVDAHQFQKANWKLRLAKLKAEGRFVGNDDLDFDDEIPQSEAEQLVYARKMIEEDLLSQMRFHVHNSDIWAAYTNKIAHFDWNTGAMDKEIPLTGDLERFIANDTSLMALCEKPLGEKVLTHIRLPAGEAQTELIKPEPARTTNVAKTKLPDVDIPLRAMTVHIRPDFIDGATERYFESAVGTYLVNAGPNVAEMKVTMIEEKITQQRTMKERTGKSVLDGDIRVTQTADVANEILNDIQEQRTGGVRFDDESRYMVTLRRKLAAGTTPAPDWVGEVKGPPQLFPLKTVDVLTAGKTMIVIDKFNQKRWEATLAYPASAAMTLGGFGWGSADDSDSFMPCLEHGNTLFFYDQGVLAAFDIATGNARWRLPSVGVSSLKFDAEGMMYVISTSAQQEQIKYTEQIDVRRKVKPVMMKVDPRTGQIIWTLNQTGQSCLFSGKYFYAVEAFIGGGKRFGKEVPAHTRIYRLHPRDGRVIWDHVEKHYPVDIDFQDNQIVALFPGEMKVLRFLSL
jgi:putative pyrroloquinoline-quinone binding quinoprotein